MFPQEGKRRRRTRVKTCGGKRRFRDQQEALRAMRTIQKNPRLVRPVRAYECHACNGWHLTSQGGS